MTLAYIPSPSEGVVHLGPVPLRGYALMIILGVVVAVIMTDRRLRARGERAGLSADVATWAVPFGIVGARIYHLITSPDAYFYKGGRPVQALEIWKGGLGIWGAVLGGALGVWIALRRFGVPFGKYADAAAPGLIVAQAIGRWGNWFNQELYGRPTHLPWALRIDAAHQAVPGVSLYQPTFLYESLWDLLVAAVLLHVDRRHRLHRGKLLALYAALYTFGRGWIESLRIDTAHHFLGLRINDWVSIVVFVTAVAVLLLYGRRRPLPLDLDVPPPGPPVSLVKAGAGPAAPADDGASGRTGPAARAPS